MSLGFGEVLAAAARAIPWWAIGRWWGRAVLDIHVDPNKTYDVVPIGNLAENPRGRFCHFAVRNTGRTVARRCRARLMSVSRMEGEGEVPEPGFRAPRTLKWANEPDAEPRSIDMGGPLARRSDLCYTIEGSDQLRFFVSDAEKGLGVQTAFPKGVYRVRVQVDSENAASARATLEVNFRGSWEAVTVRMIE